MATKREKSGHSYYIKLMRPAFQAAILTVRARSEKEAVSIALKRAPRVDDAEWIGRFDGELYAYDVQDVYEAGGDEDASELGVIETRPPQTVMEQGPATDIHYLLLRADIEIGQGDLLAQPWLDTRSSVLLADLCHDWSYDIDALEEKG